MSVARLHRNVFEINIKLSKRKDWEHWMLLTSDRHWDNPKSDHELQRQHLEEAKERGALVLDFGDFFCAMQGKWDKRSNKRDIRPEHNTDDYLDSLVRTAADFFEPYAQLFTVIASGNHEQSIKQRHETNLIERLCARLNDRTHSKVHHGGFAGWVIFRFHEKNSTTKKGTSILQSTILHYDHGYGGSAQLTGDVIQHERRASYLPDANIIVTGHTHDAWHKEKARARLSAHGKPYTDIQTHIKLPSYKDMYQDGFGGWATRKGIPPKPTGAYWLKFTYRHPEDRKARGRVIYDVLRAR